MLGGLLGAAHAHISGYITNQLACHEDLFAVLRSFTSWLRSPAGTLAAACPSFVELERKVTLTIAQTPDLYRTDRYNRCQQQQHRK
jgi:hypothetical protein